MLSPAVQFVVVPYCHITPFKILAPPTCKHAAGLHSRFSVTGRHQTKHRHVTQAVARCIVGDRLTSVQLSMAALHDADGLCSMKVLTAEALSVGYHCRVAFVAGSGGLVLSTCPG